MSLSQLPNHLLMEMALDYNMMELLSLCRTSKRMNNLLCNNPEFWRSKLIREYPDSYNYFVKRNETDWKNIYQRLHRVKSGRNLLFRRIYEVPVDKSVMDPLLLNPSGLSANAYQGWTLRLDKDNKNIVYMYPASYWKISPVQRVAEGENHPVSMLKITFSPKPMITLVPWDEKVEAYEQLHYRRGNGKVSWYDQSYMFKYEYDGMYHMFNVYHIMI